MIDEAPSLDQQVITADLTTMIAMHMFEGLYTFDSKYAPVPMLVKEEEVKNEGKDIVLRLREGIKFHNGKELTAEDVYASLVRWSKFGSRGPVLFNNIEKMEITGKYEVSLYFKQPFAPWKNLLAFMNGGPAIYPKEVAEKAEKTPIPETEYFGPGPYKFVERTPAGTSSWPVLTDLFRERSPLTVTPEAKRLFLTRYCLFPFLTTQPA